MTLSDRDAKLLAEMQARLLTQPTDNDFVARLARRRHEAAIAAGVRCPKVLRCAICDAERTKQ